MSTCNFCDHPSGPIYIIDAQDAHGQHTGHKLSICHTCHSLGHGGPAHAHQPTHHDSHARQFAHPAPEMHSTRPKTKK